MPACACRHRRRRATFCTTTAFCWRHNNLVTTTSSQRPRRDHSMRVSSLSRPHFYAPTQAWRRRWRRATYSTTFFCAGVTTTSSQRPRHNYFGVSRCFICELYDTQEHVQSVTSKRHGRNHSETNTSCLPHCACMHACNNQHPCARPMAGWVGRAGMGHASALSRERPTELEDHAGGPAERRAGRGWENMQGRGHVGRACRGGYIADHLAARF